MAKVNFPRSILISLAAFFCASGTAFAAGGAIPHFIDYYAMILGALGFDAEGIKTWTPVVGALFILMTTVLCGLVFSSSVSKADVAPESRFSFRGAIEMVLDFVHGLTKENIGHGHEKYFGFLAGLFLFILIGNLSGLIPGFPPPTVNFSTNLAMGACVFIVYNIAGIKEHGGHYIKQFMGPVAWIAPIVMGIELISHASRPLSLGLRLMGNIFADHLMLAAFTGITYLVVPAVLMFFGLLVAAVQSYVFTLLAAIYISMARSHDH